VEPLPLRLQYAEHRRMLPELCSLGSAQFETQGSRLSLVERRCARKQLASFRALAIQGRSVRGYPSQRNEKDCFPEEKQSSA
jgi:hypothetical protein